LLHASCLQVLKCSLVLTAQDRTPHVFLLITKVLGVALSAPAMVKNAMSRVFPWVTRSPLNSKKLACPVSGRLPLRPSRQLTAPWPRTWLVLSASRSNKSFLSARARTCSGVV